MKIRNFFMMAAVGLMAVVSLSSCDDILGEWDKPAGSGAVAPQNPQTTTTITLNLDGNLFNNDKLYLLSGDAAINIATITEGAPVTITSSDENVITIDADGNVVPVGPGTATITIKVTESEKYTGATETVTIVVGRMVSLADETGTEFVAQNGDQITGTAPNTMHLSIADGALVRLKDATIIPTSGSNTAGIICQGDATLFIEGVNDVKGNGISEAGIQAGPEGTKLTINSQTLTSSLEVVGGNYAAAIGSKSDGVCGDLEIAGGVITASCYQGACIGGGSSSKCGNIIISGGKITASSRYGSAIGSGCAWSENTNSDCGDIIITGGEIDATTSSSTPEGNDVWMAAAIGTGYAYGTGCTVKCGNIKITGGKVTATTGNATNVSYAAAIGTAGTSNTVQCGNIIIEGGTIIATSINTSNFSGAGIGTGYISANHGKCGDILISGGTINATGGQSAAGIGTGVVGYDGSSVTCGDITISGGTVTAHSTSTGSGIADIGAGAWWGTGGTRAIGTITLDATNGANYTKVSDTNYKHN